jgi:hypothetical protein
MTTFKLALGMIAFTTATMAQAGSITANLPLVEGGLLVAGVVGLVAGIRAIQRKK